MNKRNVFLLYAAIVTLLFLCCSATEARSSVTGSVHFLLLPIDHGNPSRGMFWGYYVVGPRQDHACPPTFFLADGQMNMVRPVRECSEFQDFFGGAPFILPCVRGFSPELLGKCKRGDGTLDLEMAGQVFASWQQVEDIEIIRQNLVQTGILPRNGKVSICGASGGGLLAQEYVTKYPEKVYKLILEVTGSPVIARRHNVTLIRNLVDYDARLTLECELLRRTGFNDFEKLSYVLYNLGRLNKNGSKDLIRLVSYMNQGDMQLYENYLKNGLFNLASQTEALLMPQRVGCMIRLSEIWEDEVVRYQQRGRRPINLGYEWMSYCLSDLLMDHAASGVTARRYEFDLARFQGDTLVIAGTEDIVFSPDMARSLIGECEHGLAAFLIDGHGMEKNWRLVAELRCEFLANPQVTVRTDARFRSILFESSNRVQ